MLSLKHLGLPLRLSCCFDDIVRNMLGRLVAVSSFVATFLLIVLLYATKPATIGPLGILIVFILMYVSVLGVLTFLLYGTSRIIHKVSASFTVKKPLPKLSLNKSYYFSSVVALAPVMFVAMQSVGEVGIYEVLLVALFVIIACVYIAKRTA
jgi:hypothetical protein